MDQCVSMGPNSIGLMEFNGHHCFLHRLYCEKALHFVVADLRASKDTIKILRSLNDCFPVPTSEAEVKFIGSFVVDSFESNSMSSTRCICTVCAIKNTVGPQ